MDPNHNSVARGKADSLWKNSDFMNLWGGETLSQIGTRITAVALPLTAIISLNASPGEIGLLGAVQYAPILLVSLFAGVWLDRHRHRPALIITHLGRAALLSLIPILYIADMLTMTLVFAIAFAVGMLTAFFDVAYVSYLPELVPKSKLVEGNAKLEATYSMSAVGGAGLGGALVQMLTAPFAIFANVITYIIAGLLSIRIKHQASSKPRDTSGPSPWAALKEGVMTTLSHPILRPILLQSACFNLFAQTVFTLFLLHGVRNLHLSAGTLGVILATGSLGGLAGTIIARQVAQKFGTGPTIVWSIVLGVVPLGLIPAAAGSKPFVILALVIGLMLHGVGLAVFNVHLLSVRAMLISSDALGRVTGTWRFISNGTLPLGGLLAGLLAEVYGVRTAMFISIAALTGCCIFFVLSRVRRFVTDGISTNLSS